MKNETRQQEMKIVFFLLSGIILVTFSIATFVEGILAQTSGYSLVATTFYFVSMLSIGATIWIYLKGKHALGTLY
ncbi:MAG: hypothetical protein ABIJ74_02760 [archaeon]